MRKYICSISGPCLDTGLKCRKCTQFKRYVRADVAIRYARMRERAMINKMVEQSPSVIAEILRDENALYNSTQLRYVEGKIEVPVGHWAWMRIREIVAQQASQREESK